LRLGKTIFSANGKVLLTGEYLVLYGAKALAFPAYFGQTLEILHNLKKTLVWQAYQPKGKWFEAEFAFSDFTILQTSSQEKAHYLKKILLHARELNNNFLRDENSEGLSVLTKTDFPIEWGLGTSSTLISTIAQWAGVDPFALHQLSSNGSGYDIACASSQRPIVYKRLLNSVPKIQVVDFNKSFIHHLYFIYSGHKKSTERHISNFLETHEKLDNEIEQLNSITEQIVETNKLDNFMELLGEHERLIGSIVEMKPLQESHYVNFDGVIKSLGAWGGDFFLAVTKRNANYVKGYFEQFSLSDIIPFNKMIRQ
jgi:mevalonate kinase